MTTTIKAGGDTWRAESSGEGSTRVVMFYCESTNQRPYRVLAVGEGADVPNDLDALSSEQLKDLFDRSGSMGAPTGYPTYDS